MPYTAGPTAVSEVGAAKQAHGDAVTIRRARPGDAVALARLVALDGGRQLAGDLLLAVIEGELWAALSLADGTVASDPFRPAAAARALLLLRADHLAAAAGRGGRLGVLGAAARRLRLS